MAVHYSASGSDVAKGGNSTDEGRLFLEPLIRFQFASLLQ